MKKADFIIGGVLFLGLVYSVLSVFNPFYSFIEFRNSFETIPIPLFKIPYPGLDEWVQIDGIIGWKDAIAKGPGYSLLSTDLSLALTSISLSLLTIAGLKAKRIQGLIILSLVLAFFGSLPYEELVLNRAQFKWPMLAAFGLLALGYLFKDRKWMSGLIGLVLFSVAYFAVFELTCNYSEVAHPELTLVQLYTIPLLIGGVVFVVIVSYEPLHFMAILTSQKGQLRKNGFLHFSIFSLLYLGNLLLYYLSSTTALLDDFNSLNPLFYLVISGAIGFFLAQKLSENLGFWEEPRDGKFFFGGLGLILLSLISWSYQNSNSAFIEVISDATLFTHLGVGFFYAIYIGVNFGTLYSTKVQFESVLAKGKNFPFFMVWIGGLVVVVLLFLRSGKFQLFQSQGAYYAAIADSYYSNEEKTFAKVFNERSAGFAYRNHKALYALSWQELEKGNRSKALLNLEQALLQDPREEDFILSASIYEKSNSPFDQNFTLRKGLKTIPGSAGIKNNYGLSFRDLNIIDSAIHYFNKVGADGKHNIKALILKKNLGPKIPEIGAFDQQSPNDWLLAIRGLNSPIDQIEKSSNFPTYYNKNLYKVFTEKTSPLPFPDTAMKNIRINRANLAMVWSLSHLNNRKIDSACYRMAEALELGQGNLSYFQPLVAKLFFSLGAYDWALNHFEELRKKGWDKEAHLVTLAEFESASLSDRENTISLVQTIASNDSTLKELALAIELSLQKPLNWSDAESALNSIQSDELKELVSKSWIRNSELEEPLLKYCEDNGLDQRGSIGDAYSLKLLKNDTSEFLSFFQSRKTMTDLTPLANSFFHLDRGEMSEALETAQEAYSLMPWQDEVILQLCNMLIENDSISLAYNFMLKHINHLGRTKGASIAIARASLFFGLESNLDHELEWLVEHQEPEEYESTKRQLELLRERLRAWN